MFSMCSELTPCARIPDTRIPQLMQPWVCWGKFWTIASVPFLCLNFLCVLFFTHHLISEQLTILLYYHQSSREAYASGRELVSATAANVLEHQLIQTFAVHQGKFWTKNQVFESSELFPDVPWRRWPVMAVSARKFSQTGQLFHHQCKFS